MPNNKQRKKRATRAKGLRGKGDYTSGEDSIKDQAHRLEAKIDHLEKSINKKATVRSVAGTVGRALGGLVGQGDLGSLAGDSLAKLFGHGDFSVTSNSLFPSSSNFQSSVVPKFSTHKRGTRIVEREFVGTVSSGSLVGGVSEFFNTSYSINPADSATFPWLHTLASQYDQWEPNGIVFEFISTSSEYNGANQALGVVIMATDYDVMDPLYTNKQTMENADYSCATKPSVSMLHGIECDPKERPMPLLYTGHRTDSDPRFHTMGNFQVATVGMSAAGIPLGELWVSYDITFYKKQVAPLVEVLPSLYASGDNIVGKGLFSGVETFKANKIAIDNDTIYGASRFRFTKAKGRYLFTYIMSSFNGESKLPITYVGCNVVTTGGTQVQYLPLTALGEPVLFRGLFDVTSDDAFMDFGTKLLFALGWNVVIAPVPPDYYISI